MVLIHINLNNCEAAQDLLSQTIRGKGIGVAIVCEPYRNYGDGVWTRDQTGKAARWACGGQAIQEVMQRPEAGFVRAKMGGIHVYSCYAPPQYEMRLHHLVLDAKSHTPKIIVGAWACELGSRRANERGCILREAFAELDVVLANIGNSFTFRGRGLGSIVDLVREHRIGKGNYLVCQ